MTSSMFDESHANAYDERWKRLAPIGDGLHYLMGMVLSDLPAEANVLCVGAGTGLELIALAEAHPTWRFTAVEPAAAMLAVCRKKAVAAGIASRCTFHEGYLDSLSAASAFDAATSILVSQFLTDPHSRREYFKQISTRLRPGARLVTADLATSLDAVTRQSLYEIWLRTHSGLSAAEAKAGASGWWGPGVAVSKPEEISTFITSAGFDEPVLFYQALFIHAWYAMRI